LFPDIHTPDFSFVLNNIPAPQSKLFILYNIPAYSEAVEIQPFVFINIPGYPFIFDL